MSLTALTVQSMTKPHSRYDVTVRVAYDSGRQPDPAAFAVAASKAASSRDASVVSAHMADEIICVVSVHALDRPLAVAVALAVVADAVKAEVRVRSPSRGPMPAVVGRLEEHCLPE
jgi:hypothetical protein